MYPNIDAEQARHKLNNTDIAKALHLTPYTYGQKKLKGSFTVNEAKIMCKLLKSEFGYLFETQEDMEAR